MIYCKFLLHEEKMLFIERQLKVEIEDGCKAPKKPSILYYLAISYNILRYLIASNNHAPLPLW